MSRTSSSEWSHTFTVRITPALFTHTSRLPFSAAARATARWASGSRTSWAIDHAPPPSCSAVSAAPASSMSVQSTS